MSGEIVVTAGTIATPLLLTGGIAVLPMLLAGGAMAGAAMLGTTAAQLLEDAAERRRNREAEELAALGRQIDRLARSAAAKAPPQLSREFVESNRQSIQDMLANVKLETLDMDQFGPTGGPPPAPPPDALPRCRELYARLALVDEGCARDCAKFMAGLESAPAMRQNVVYDNLRIEYGNALRRRASRLWRSRTLQRLLASLDGDAARDFAAELGRNPEAHADEAAFKKLLAFYAQLLEKDLLRKQNDLLEERLIAEMKKLGYAPVAAREPGAPYFFYTSEPDYRVMARVNPANGQLSLRFVRVVASEEEKRSLTTAQQRRDMEQEQKWCGNARRLLAAVSAELGLEFEELYRREPGEDHRVLAVVDTSLARQEKRSGANVAG